jgi:hypothetical protein
MKISTVSSARFPLIRITLREPKISQGLSVRPSSRSLAGVQTAIGPQFFVSGGKSVEAIADVLQTYTAHLDCQGNLGNGERSEECEDPSRG